MSSPFATLRRQIIKAHRKSIAREVFRRYDGVIQRGPFEGVRFDGHANISEAAHGLKIFGLYEEPVTQRLLGFAGADTFIDVGAGDGYYPVALLTKGAFKRAIAFEATEAGRSAIGRNARLNSVEDRLRIFGRADADLLDLVGSESIDWMKTAILFDIEGGEFSVIDKRLLAATPGARYIVELHDPVLADLSLRAGLVERFRSNWNVEIVTDRARDWHGIEEVKGWHDLDRAVLFSEGRKIIGEWLVATPR
jgi:hypothetical protein